MDQIAPLASALADRYAVEREIGAGGMATVYLARDLKHDRRVALKVLRPELGAVLGVERFLGEIKVTANLQHPNLLPLFDSGEAGGLLFYVMPFVEGESLRARLEREKQFPVDEAVRISVAIANALDYAHSHGVIHRDLKPENILLQAGQPVVADFGIALAVSKAGGQRITQTGLSLGTPQYMSPEQATGDRVIDGRSDIYSLGAITYEMLTGEPPHIGSTAQAIIARVLTDKPRAIRSTRSAVPEYVEAAVDHALEKLPADRFGTAHEFAEALQGRGAGLATRATLAHTASRAAGGGWRARMRDPLVLSLAALSVVSVGLAAAMSRPAPASAPTRAIRYVVALSDSMRRAGAFPYPAAISPDGSTIAFMGQLPGKPPMMWVLRSDQLVPQPIPGTETSFQPLFSPDGQWLAFEVNGHEKKVRLDGSAPVTISVGGAANGADWTTRNELVLGSQGTFAGLTHVSVGGGEPVALTVVDSARHEQNHLWPIAFPDGKTVAFIVWYGELATAKLGLTSLDDGKVTTLDVKAVRPLAVVDGRLVYVQADGQVMALRIDTRARRAIGQPVPVHDPVLVLAGNNGNSNIFVSSGGALITGSGGSKAQLGWYDGKRVFHPLVTEPRDFQLPRFSPDGRRVAVIITDEHQSDLWIDDLATSTMTRLTSTGTISSAEWLSDGKSLLVGTGRGTVAIQPAFGGAAMRMYSHVPELSYCSTIAPDGKHAVASVLHNNTWDLVTFSADSTIPPKPFVATAGQDLSPQFSPDGKWLAYMSDESGSMEVYVRSFPDAESRVQISAGLGFTPMWGRDGRTIYYQHGTTILRARTSGPPTFQVLSRDTAFAGVADVGSAACASGFDMSADGTRFLTVRREPGGEQLVAVPNWIVEYRERLKLAEGTK